MSLDAGKHPNFVYFLTQILLTQIIINIGARSYREAWPPFIDEFCVDNLYRRTDYELGFWMGLSKVSNNFLHIVQHVPQKLKRNILHITVSITWKRRQPVHALQRIGML